MSTPLNPKATMTARRAGTPTLMHCLLDREAACDGSVAYRFITRGDLQPLEWSYATLVAQAKRLAAALQQRGLRGERVLILCAVGEDYSSVFFACLLAGAIAVPCTPLRGTRHRSKIVEIVKSCAPRLVVCDEASMRPLAELLQPAGLQGIELADPARLAAEGHAWQCPDVAPGDTALLQYTSGSTSDPKGVVVTHASIMANLAGIETKFGLGPDSRGMVWLPPYHDMGLIGGVLSPVHTGYPITLLSPLLFIQKPVRWLQLISRYGITASGGPNFGYQACVERVEEAECAGLDLGSWELAFNGAERVDAQTLERFTRRFAPHGFRGTAHYPTYGMAESTLMISGGSRGAGYRVLPDIPGGGHRAEFRDAVSCGSALDGHELLIVDPESRWPVAEGGMGEVWVRGPSVAVGYWGHPGEAFRGQVEGRAEHFLRTGDLGVLRGGELYILGRMKEVIIVRGANFFPTDLENAIRGAHEALNPEGVVVFSHAGEAQEESIVVMAELRRAARDTPPEAIRARITAALVGEFDLRPIDVVLLPFGGVLRTSSGKPMRMKMKQLYLERAREPEAVA
ncbi:fatty acyl-AMP ligase [Acidovorax sp. NCPPB 2350]|nr:fatty acyl-AMP ligase [Acidovorax sp. NCPPB 2350]